MGNCSWPYRLIYAKNQIRPDHWVVCWGRTLPLKWIFVSISLLAKPKWHPVWLKKGMDEDEWPTHPVVSTMCFLYPYLTILSNLIRSFAFWVENHHLAKVFDMFHFVGGVERSYSVSCSFSPVNLEPTYNDIEILWMICQIPSLSQTAVERPNISKRVKTNQPQVLQGLCFP